MVYYRLAHKEQYRFGLAKVAKWQISQLWGPKCPFLTLSYFNGKSSLHRSETDGIELLLGSFLTYGSIFSAFIVSQHNITFYYYARARTTTRK
ncbi:MAG: hypothetical protein GY820_32260 [Gammaproteobacteria bacterium]|nr:hypothetical protein [Gammaproteobacteria bacterium]